MNKIKTFIVDDIMGSGKSSAAINYINNSSEDKKFLVITPYLEEIKRYKQMCPQKHFREPIYDKGTKLDNIRDLLRNGHNVVSTHALFHKFDTNLISICETLEYTLIMDEVTDVVEEYPITDDDIENLLNTYCMLEESSGRLIWKEEHIDYEGKFSEVKAMCISGSVVLARRHMLLWLFPVEVFNAFSEVYILTFMFDAQIQRYYYDYCGVEYKYLYVSGDNISNYSFSNNIKDKKNKYDYSELINIEEHEKLNIIGKDKHALSKSWYMNNNKTALMKQLKNNINNYFRHVEPSSSKNILWASFIDYKQQLSGKGYTKGFLAINARATNLYKDRDHLAYLVNIYFNPMIKGFFQDHGIEVDEEGYALSEMLQWIWRSAIRDKKEIFIYIPSRRMRGLLEDWIVANCDAADDNVN